VSEKISAHALPLECLQNDNTLPKEVNLSILRVEKVRCSREYIKDVFVRRQGINPKGKCNWHELMCKTWRHVRFTG
jgi:hypothetical protein